MGTSAFQPTSPLHAAAMKNLLDKLFKAEHFSICTLREMVSLYGKPVDKSILQQLAAFHCTDYAAMSPEVYDLIQDGVLRLFRGGSRVNTDAMFKALCFENDDQFNTEDAYLDTPVRRLPPGRGKS